MGRFVRLGGLVLVALLAATALPAPALAQGVGAGGDNDLVVLTGGAQVAEGDTVGDVVVFDGPVAVDGSVQGSVVAFNGPVRVSGEVSGDVVGFNGRIAVQRGARIGGDVRARSGADVDPAATVTGAVRGLDLRVLDEAAAAVKAGVWLAFSVSTLVLALAFVLLFPGAADTLVRAGSARTGASIGWGLALFFGVPILAVLLLVTVLGIPLGIGLLLLIAPLYALGYTAAAFFLGRRIVGPPRSRAIAALVGVVILRAVALIPILAGLTWFLATVFGLGLLAVAAREGRRLEAEPMPAAARPQEA
jgi:hypothetical protein